MSDSPMAGNYFVPHPRQSRANFLPIDDPIDIAWSVIVGVAFLAIGSAVGDYASIAWAAGAGFWVLSMWPVFRSKDERLYFLALIAPILEFVLFLRKGKVWKKGEREKYPYEVHVIGDMGLLYHIYNKTYSLVFYTEGSRISTYDLVSQLGQNSQLAEIVRRASAITGLKGLKFNFGFDVRPGDPFAVKYMLAERGNVDVMLPEVLFPDHHGRMKPEAEWTREDRRFVKLRTVANEMEEMALNAAKVTMTVTVTVKDNRKFQKILKKGFTYDKDIRGLTIVQVRNTLSALLKTVYENPYMLNGFQAEEHLKVAWDAAGMDDYYTNKMLASAERAEMAEAPDQLDDSSEPETVKKIPEVFHAPKEYITAHADCLAMDGTFATVIKVTEFPLDQPSVDYVREYSSVFNIPAPYYSIDISGQTKKGSLQYFAKDASGSFTGTVREMLGNEKRGIAAEEAAAQQEEEMRRFRASYTIDFTPSVAILSGDREAMEQSAVETVGQMTERNFGPARLTGRLRQERTVLATLTHIPE